MPWVGRISFGDLVEKVEEIATKPIMCNSCGGALTNPGIIQIDPSKGKYFLCEFCGLCERYKPLSHKAIGFSWQLLAVSLLLPT